MAIKTTKTSSTVAVKKAGTTRAKAVVKKAVVKKAVAKKGTSGKALTYATNEQSFWVCDGQILNSLLALHGGLSVMSKETYSHHVSQGRNDFAEWVATVLQDSACATDLRKAKTPQTAKIAVAKHLKTYVL